MPTFYRYCSLEEARKAQTLTRWVEEIQDEITCTFVKDRFEIFSSVCPHFGGPLRLHSENEKLKCEWHGWCFDLASGKCVSYPIPGKVRRYRHREVNGDLEIEIP